MRLYRVFPHDPTAAAGKPGHVDYAPRQGKGRWDNPDRYVARYFARSPEGAIGEAFGNLGEWSEAMFDMPGIGRRALAEFDVPDTVRLFDFDDATNLAEFDIRPSRVVARDHTLTQQLAARLHGTGDWDGVAWWSFHWPDWTNVMLWGIGASRPRVRLISILPLGLGTEALRTAKATLGRKIVT